MKVFYIGTPPQDFLDDAWPSPPEQLYEQPMFLVDALFVFPGSPLEVESRLTYQLVERMGRPIIRLGAVNFPIDRRHMPGNLLLVARYAAGDAPRYESWIAGRPRTNYLPVEQELMDQVRQCVASGADVQFTLRQANGLSMVTTIAAVDVKALHGEDYVQMEDGCWFRMDRILAINGNTFSQMR